MGKHLCTGLAGGLLLLGTAGLSQATSLVITGVIDGPLSGGTPKAVELYACNGINDLSIYGLGFANNGGGSDGIEFTFPSISAAAGDFFYVASEAEEFFNFFGFAPDATSSAATINGDDAIELFKGGTVVDVFGDIAVDGTGQPWEYLDGWAYRNDAGGDLGASAFLLSEWHFSGPDALDGATFNLEANYPFPAGSFSPGTTPQPVPEPASLLLLGSGLAALAGSPLRQGGRKR
jgi:hypothetical protein